MFSKPYLRHGLIGLMILTSSSCVSSPKHASVPAAQSTPGPQTNLTSAETVLLFPTNAQLDKKNNQWQVHIHGWVFEPEQDSSWRNGTIGALKLALDVEKGTPEAARFTARTGMFLVDNKDEKNIVIQVGEQHFSAPTTNGNGHFDFSIRLDEAKQSCQNWLPIRVLTTVNDSRTFSGAVQCIGTQGISVISDIDDTIKQSNVLDKKQFMKNTFLKQFAAVPGMADVYKTWHAQGAAFHYVSSSPWQLYPALSDFMNYSGYPKGSMHLKLFRVKDSSFFNMFDSPEEGKIPTISKLLEAYPQRQFILVGDSGEKDPEIYATIAQRYPKQIKRIYIHDVSNSRARLKTVFKDLEPKQWLVFNDASQILPHYRQR